MGISKAPFLVRSIFAASLSLALTGCAAGDPDNGADKELTGEAKSALQTAYDFVANAPGASWYNNAGGLPWGANSIDSSGAGACSTASGVVESGATKAFLYTNPFVGANGYVRGSYSVTIPAASLHPTLTATFGFKQGASGGDGATFSLATQVTQTDADSGEVRTDWVPILRQKKTYTGALTTLTADLSAYGGTTIPIALTVDAGPNGDFDWAVWTDLRITADSVTPPTACTIGGVGYASGDVNPASPCQICDPNVPTAWTIRGDSCLIGGQCYIANTQDSLKCKRCDPGLSQTSWSSQNACDNLVVAVTNATWSGDLQHAWVNGNIVPYVIDHMDNACANEGAALGLPGQWRGAISVGSTRDYRDALPSDQWTTRPVVNLQGQQLFSSWSAIFSNQVWPAGLPMYRFGNATNPAGAAYTGQVWTGTGLDGKYGFSSGLNCWAWGSFFSSSNALVGDMGQRKLLNGGVEGTCDAYRPVTCVLQPSASSVVVFNPDGSTIGTIQATTQGNTFAFLGVPYAKPPTPANNLRFAPPAPVAAFTGVYNASSWKPVCAQKGFLGGTVIGDEDCLYLNIWKPKTAYPGSNLPVIVFHHGGGLMYGGATAVHDFVGVGTYNGDRLASAQNMIVITLQTRLGALGYLASTELSADPTSSTKPGGGTSGNYGLLDALQALKWVKKNIYSFGGDPNKVTFAGQSGGATLVAMLLASKLALDASDNTKPYFSSAFLMSGFYEEPTKETRYNQASAIMASLKAGCTDTSSTVKCLRTAPVANFINATDDFLLFIPNIINGVVTPDAAFGMKFGPNIDGYVIPNQPRTIFADASNTNHPRVPVILGTTQKEFWSAMVTGWGGILNAFSNVFSTFPPNFTKLTSVAFLTTCSPIFAGQEPFSFEGRAKMNLGAALGATAASLYPCAPLPGSLLPGLGPNNAYAMALTHAQYECPARRSARALIHGQTQSVRRYMFTHNADKPGLFQNLLGFGTQIGAAHALDLMYVFNNQEAYIYTPPLTHITFPPGIFEGFNWGRTYFGPSPRELDLAGRYQTFIRNFAATTDPNCSAPGTCLSPSAANYWAPYDSRDYVYNLKAVGETGGSDPGPQMTTTAVDSVECDFWDQNFAINDNVSTCTPSCTGKVCGSDGCGGTCGTCGAGLTCTTDQSACLSSLATATVSGFSSCSCLNGTFPLSNVNGVWTSQPITGCPGQSQPAYVKFRTSNNSFGITNQSSQPGSGNSDYSPGTVVTSSPFKATGGASVAGNINSFCPGSEDLNMSWTVNSSQSCTPSCSGKVCGADGCGGACGTCSAGSACNATQSACVAVCTPSCSGKVCGSDGCGGSCGTCGSGLSCSANQSACVSSVATATVSGFTSCTCLNGNFPLTNTSGVWSSLPITGCPGQTQPAYVKFRTDNNSFGITNQTSNPGSGNSDYSPGTVISSSPFKASGGGSQAGNINSFCPGSEDLNMSWLVDTTPGGCTPSCSGKVCGSNGCGGTCGTCGSGLTCNANQTACVAGSPGQGTKLTGVTYTQSDSYPSNNAATYAYMNDDNANGSTNNNQAGTNTGTDKWIKADAGSAKFISQIVVGYDYLNNLPGGWGVTYTAGLIVEGSTDNTTWTNITTLPTYASTGSSNGLAAISVNGTWRYIRLRRASGYACVLEFQLRTTAISGNKLTGVTYTQSDSYPTNNAATYAYMNDDNSNGSTNNNQAGTNSGTDKWIKADAGSAQYISQIVLGYDYLNNLPGGWGVTYTEGLIVEGSTDNTTWTNITTVPTYASTGSTNGLAAIPINGTWRYVRLRRASGYACTLEFQLRN